MIITDHKSGLAFMTDVKPNSELDGMAHFYVDFIVVPGYLYGPCIILWWV